MSRPRSQGSLEYIIIIGGVIILAAATYFMLRGFVQTTGAGTADSIEIAGDTLRLELENLGRSETKLSAKEWGPYPQASRLTVENTGTPTTTQITLNNLTDYGLELDELEFAYNDSGEIKTLDYSVQGSSVTFTTPPLPAGDTEVIIFHTNSSAIELDNLDQSSQDTDVTITDGTEPEEAPDVTSPTIVIFSQAFGYSGSVKDADIKIIVSDDASAISGVYYSIDNSPYFQADNMYYGYEGMTLEGHPEDHSYNSNSETIHIIATVPAEDNYTIRVKAEDIYGNEKVETKEVSIIVSPGAESNPPVLLDTDGVNNTVVDDPVLSLNLSTDEPAVCKFATSPNIPYEDMEFFSESGSTFHQENISLMDGVNYEYFCNCEDIFGNTNNTTFTLNFTKSGTDSTPPQITDSEPANNSLVYVSFLAVNLTTNENAECRFATAGGIAFGTMAGMDTTGYTFHQHTFMLVSEESYRYYFRCNDSNGNENTTDYVLNFTKAYEEEAAIVFSGPLSMNGSGIYNVSEIIGNMVNITELIVHNLSLDKALFVRHDMTNAVIESTGSSPLLITSSLNMLLETLAGNITFKPAGNLGIATESPSTKLDVNGTTTTVALDTGSVNDNEYYCSTLSEINNALSDIGSGGGTIIIESGTIPVTSPINIDEGGSYAIQGQGADTVLTQPADDAVFNITSAASLVIENLKIDASGVTTLDTSSFRIVEGSDNTVTIRNVIVDGANNTFALGCYIISDNVRILNSEFNGIKDAIKVIGKNVLIRGNMITNIGSADAPAGANDAEGCSAIFLSPGADRFSVTDNLIYNVTSGDGGAGSGSAGGDAGSATGIYIYGGSFGSVSGNTIDAVTSGNGGNGAGGDGGSSAVAVGIWISGGSGTNTVIEGNVIRNLTGGAGGDGSNGYNGGSGGTCIGIYNHEDYISSVGNIIDTFNGGGGGAGGGVDDDGGSGGAAQGIRYDTADNGVIGGNIINNLYGSNGGNGGATSGTGGNGGLGLGLYILNSNYTSITGNIAYTIIGGNGGTGATLGTDRHNVFLYFSGVHYSSISGNVQVNNTANNGKLAAGIYMTKSSYNSMTGNDFCQILNSGSDSGYGIRIQDSTSTDNLVYGNTLLGNDVNLYDGGTNTFGDATTNNVA